MASSLTAVRAITEAEAAVVVRVLTVAATDSAASQLIPSVRSLQVVGGCDCGCASVDFLLLPQDQIPRIVGDAAAKSATGEEIGVIAWAHEGRLAGLEVYGYGDSPASLPVIASISNYGGTSDAA